MKRLVIVAALALAACDAPVSGVGGGDAARASTLAPTCGTLPSVAGFGVRIQGVRHGISR